ncbi:MAG TPA: phage/plasmid primase, P4 family, partial [Ktedonobacteraceae bacterium]|nr:phage/plasmid primase, P4 family [Ktedonobacteraceae bacterium]
TLMSVLQFVLGATVGPVSNDVILASNKLATPGSAKPHLCSLQGKRIAWASETDRGARFDVGQVKFLTGGGSISARQLYGTDYTFEPSHLLVLLTNHKPHADSSDAAFWERLCPLLFNLRFVEHPSQPNERQRDITLGQALQAEASGILAWLVRGCLLWQREGLRLPASVRLARASYRDEEDTLGDFLQERCLTDNEARVAASDLYFHYRVWAINNGLKSLNGRAFGMEMKKRVNWVRVKSGIFYLGLAILPSDGEEIEAPTVQDRPIYDKSLDAAQQAVSGQKSSFSGAGSEGFSPKLSNTNQQKTQKESFGNHPSLSTPDGLTQEAFSPTEEQIEAPFSDTVSQEDIPTPSPDYEEFDL